MYRLNKIKGLFGFMNDLEKIVYGIGYKIKLKRKNDRALFRVNIGAAAVANDCKIKIADVIT